MKWRRFATQESPAGTTCTFWVSLATLIALAVYTAVTYSMWRTTDKTYKEITRQTPAVEQASREANIANQKAQERFLEDQRPYIWVSQLGRPQFALPPNAKGPEGYVVWNWHYTNYGKTPARGILLNHELQARNNALSLKRTFTREDFALPPLPPQKDDFTTSVTRMKISRQEYERLMNTEHAIVVYARFRYTDASGRPYETGVCIVHLRLGPTMYCPDPQSNYIH